MKLPSAAVPIVLLVLVLLGAHIQSANAAALPPSLAPVIGKAAPAVVSILIPANAADDGQQGGDTGAQPSQQPSSSRAATAASSDYQTVGSGVIIDADKGLVLTNNHVISGTDDIHVALKDNTEYAAKRIGADKDTDLAVVKIEGAKHLIAIRPGDSAKLQVGDYVLAIGTPFGLGQSVTFGIVSALGRSNLGTPGYEDFIQTDASINPGSSGGPLLNVDGEMVGINSALFSPAGGNVGIGFAIPADVALRIARELIAHGRIDRAQLGVIAEDLTPALARVLGLETLDGAVVTRVLPGSAAAQAGIEPGDVISTLDAKTVADAADLHTRVASLHAGEIADLLVLRGGKHLTLTARLSQEAVAGEAERAASPLLTGVSFGRVPPEVSTGSDANGAYVVSVDTQSLAAARGLRRGDIVVAVDGKPARSMADALSQSDRYPDIVTLLVKRAGETLFLSIQ